MATAITTSSPTLEGQLLEVARELEVAEQAAGLNQTSLSFNIETKVVTVTVRLPLTISGSGEQIVFTAGEYITA
jgi:hypothetical protein